jgi:type VI secretion system secreted protein VgrG
MIVKVQGVGDDDLLLRGFSYSEELGRPFNLTVLVAPTSRRVKPEKLVGQALTIKLVDPGKADRYFNGIVAAASIPGNQDILEYRLSVVPSVSLLGYSSKCRWFQEESALDIVKKVISGHAVLVKDKCKEKYKALEYCVQYRESDLAFMTRLMEQAGIYYHFEHANGSNTLVLCDASTSHGDTDGYATVPFYAPGSRRSEASFDSWSLDARMCSGVFATKDYNFKTPANQLLSPENVASPFTSENLDSRFVSRLFDYPGEFADAAGGMVTAGARAEALAAAAETYSGTCDARGLFAGGLFKLTDPNGDLNDDLEQKYLVTKLSLSGQAQNYDRGTGGGSKVSCSVVAVKETTFFRLWPSTPKPVIAGAQTAIVVGPSGQEIHTDEHGRVRVRFHWDEDHDGSSGDTSCWIRVAQLWAGKQWGAVFLPRVGQEVVVQFLEGDPDRPLITGGVYNASNPVPYALPENKNIACVKSNSTTDGSGFNEIKFDDTKGKELLFVHAEKSHHVRVKGSQAIGVGGSASLGVGGDLSESVGKDHSLSVKGDSLTKVTGDMHLNVTGKSITSVTGVQSVKVTGDASLVYSGGFSHGVQGDYFVKAANICIEATTNITLKVGGTSIAIESGGVTITTSGNVEINGTGGIKASASGGKVELTGSAGVKASSAASVDLTAPMIKNNG